MLFLVLSVLTAQLPTTPITLETVLLAITRLGIARTAMKMEMEALTVPPAMMDTGSIPPTIVVSVAPLIAQPAPVHLYA